VAAFIAHDAEPLPSRLSSDPCTRFVQLSVYGAATGSTHRTVDDSPLWFLREDLEKYRGSGDGYVVVDRLGTIVWCNEALAGFFRYNPDELLTENVRILMPPPYSAQHDAYLRKYDRHGPKKIVGCSRRVPVLLKGGEHATAVLFVDEKVDPEDCSRSMFVGHMNFGDQASDLDPALLIQSRLSAGETNIIRCCRGLESHPDNVVVINPQGIIQYANDSATLLLGFDFGELVGRNVSCLMAEEHAKQHDAILDRYTDRVAAARASGAGAVESRVVGQGRDFYAKTKSGRMLRIFLTVKQVDRPSRDPKDCLFVGTLLVVQSQRDTHNADHHNTASSGSEYNSTHVALRHETKLGALSLRRCSVVVVDVVGLSKETGDGVHADYQTLLNLLSYLCTKYRGSPVPPLAGRLFITFNLGFLNNAHRGAAGSFMNQLVTMWRSAKPHSPLRLAVAGATGECVVGSFAKQPVALTKCFDVCAVLLNVHRETCARGAVVDDRLFEELQYAFECRQINIVALKAGSPDEEVMAVYEMCATKDLDDDEWMYQLSQRDKENTRDAWRE
jgi:PAS domain S-box-containing protein